MTLTSTSLVKTEKTAILTLASIYALRMLGLFMIIPVFSIYAQYLKDATPLLIGLTLGCYGLTQALFQLPLGLWSDSIGRKPIIAGGLLLLAAGSLIAGFSHSIWGVLLGRCLQGTGAVGSATSALLADLTREQIRTKAMAIIGITIGTSFSLAMIIGPLLNSWLNTNDLFFVTFILALAALFILLKWVPNPPRPQKTVTFGILLKQLNIVFLNRELLQLNFGILFLHAILTASFIVFPIALIHSTGIIETKQWELYLPVLIFAFISIAPLIRCAEKSKNSSFLYPATISVFGLATILFLFLQHTILGAAFSLWLFFTAFTFLEALLPSSVSKAAPTNYKGTALGLFSCCQFLGIFIGGFVGGWLYSHAGLNGVLKAVSMLACLWLISTIRFSFHQKISQSSTQSIDN